jgi:hypothetical protein
MISFLLIFVYYNNNSVYDIFVRRRHILEVLEMYVYMYSIHLCCAYINFIESNTIHLYRNCYTVLFEI